jgi:hypothetical protein
LAPASAGWVAAAALGIALAIVAAGIVALELGASDATDATDATDAEGSVGDGLRRGGSTRSAPWQPESAAINEK